LQAAAAAGGGVTAKSEDADAGLMDFIDQTIQDGQGELVAGIHLLESLYDGGDAIMDDARTGHKKRTTARRSEDEEEARQVSLQDDNYSWTVMPGTKKKGDY
jgi:hypothetical protein